MYTQFIERIEGLTVIITLQYQTSAGLVLPPNFCGYPKDVTFFTELDLKY